MKRFIILVKVLCLFGFTAVFSAESTVPLSKAPGVLSDQASLQRGAGVFMHYCAGCHSLRYERYGQLAKQIGIVDADGKLLEGVAKKYFNLTTEKLTDYIISAMPPDEASKWFGIEPPDLTLVARVRGTDWLYTYLRSFYADETRPWGVNNLVFPMVAMPHALVDLQGVQKAVFKTETINGEDHKVFQGFELSKPGKLNPAQYDGMVADLVNFLDHVGEPIKLERKRLGVWALLFLSVFLTFAYLLKREYWKDVH
jgi:ubiquinol-cytochrome c reductase cytochrome c1 subunit